MDHSAPVLEIDSLRTWFLTARGIGKAVDGVDLSLSGGETLGVVGESGSGKTMLSLSVLGLVPRPGRIVGGAVRFKGLDLVRASAAELLKVRGNAISMIFQEPMTSLNPVFRVGEQIAEAVRLHRKLGKAEALERARQMLVKVGIPNPDRRLKSYPHEMSGGMRQRVVIAMALALDPDLILADEPTTALDVTIQAEILELMLQLKEERQTAIMLITHDLGVVAQTCQRVAVMYAGKIVEEAPVLALFDKPLHPYTKLLLASVPRIGERRPLAAIGGAVPSLMDLPSGCAFHPRCPDAVGFCATEEPALLAMPDGRKVRCLLHTART
ncbi:ABC transporter ATP-binding protein [Desulfocurvibacter africanus]|uniref:ABC transporter ATP-binding protein n=1 Tax=Desulfocurvibacter africanus TaxID=873 RepID=UPI00041C20CA|nr:ABC transporter ATP-binding protein [Desulfocurvibacter africanus]